HERGEKNADDWEVLDVHVSKGFGVRARSIVCPKTDEWDAFKMNLKRAEPGDGETRDPLTKLDSSSFKGLLDVIDPYARAGKLLHSTFITLVPEVCPLAREAMKEEYGTLKNLCR
ncbi:hypothetical protein FOZ63_017853, partial [Perkinsus olseni]